MGETNQQTMEETHWANTFPPLGQPLKLPLWLLETHAGAMLGYPVGGPELGQHVLFALRRRCRYRSGTTRAVAVPGLLRCWD